MLSKLSIPQLAGIGLVALVAIIAIIESKSGVTVYNDPQIESALTQVRDDNQWLILDFYTDYCPACKAMESNTWRDDNVGDWMRENARRLPIDLGAVDQQHLAKEFGIRGVPTTVMLDPGGKEMDRVVGFLPPHDFLSRLEGLGSL
jgi:thiol:disulfide interchange protein DsbD